MIPCVFASTTRYGCAPYRVFLLPTRLHRKWNLSPDARFHPMWANEHWPTSLVFWHWCNPGNTGKHLSGKNGINKSLCSSQSQPEYAFNHQDSRDGKVRITQRSSPGWRRCRLIPSLNCFIVQPESEGVAINKGFVIDEPVGNSELLLCHGAAWISQGIRGVWFIQQSRSLRKILDSASRLSNAWRNVIRLMPSNSPNSLSEGSFPPAWWCHLLTTDPVSLLHFLRWIDCLSLFNPFGLNQIRHLTPTPNKESN